MVSGNTFVYQKTTQPSAKHFLHMKRKILMGLLTSPYLAKALEKKKKKR
jgi:hypothetical protein